MNGSSSHVLSVAPMMDCTDRHCRFFMRLLAPQVRLYTEMIPAAALTRGDAGRLLAFDPAEHPVALQLGGAQPAELAAAARLGAAAGYDEINLNVGCPSDRVRSGRFGACLMAVPDRVAACVSAMRDAVELPVTVKCRTGIDEQDSYRFLRDFIDTVAQAGCRVFIVHARKAILNGLSPKENREVPPLDYARVYRLKTEFPQLTVVLNGGITSRGEVESHLRRVDGVMLGREAYRNPYLLCELEATVMSGAKPPARRQVLLDLLPYAQERLAAGARLHHLVRHLLGLYAGQPGARRWRRYLSERAQEPGAGWEVLAASLALVEKGVRPLAREISESAKLDGA